MVNVSVRFLSRVEQILGLKRLEIAVEGADVKSMLEGLCRKFGKAFADAVYNPKVGELHRDISIMVNGRNIATGEGLGTGLSDGDVIVVLTPVAGGCCLCGNHLW